MQRCGGDVIRSFADKHSEAILKGQSVRGLPADIQPRARRKLRMLEAATAISDLQAPPANRLEKLRGSRSGQHSIRINDQWRICFVWDGGYVYNVEIVDYH